MSPKSQPPSDRPPTPLSDTTAAQDFADAYEALRAIAERHMRGQTPSHTLQPTALVSEAYLRLRAAGSIANDDEHLLRQASRAMRHVLVDHARRRGLLARQPRNDVGSPMESLLARWDESEDDLLGFDRSLEKLAHVDAELADLVERHVFGGLPLTACAESFGVSERQIYRRWQAARCFLRRELEHAVKEG